MVTETTLFDRSGIIITNKRIVIKNHTIPTSKIVSVGKGTRNKLPLIGWLLAMILIFIYCFIGYSSIAQEESRRKSIERANRIKNMPAACSDPEYAASQLHTGKCNPSGPKGGKASETMDMFGMGMFISVVLSFFPFYILTNALHHIHIITQGQGNIVFRVGNEQLTDTVIDAINRSVINVQSNT